MYTLTPLETDDDKEYKEAAWTQDEVGGYQTYVDANEEEHSGEGDSKSEGQGGNGNGLNVLKIVASRYSSCSNGYSHMRLPSKEMRGVSCLT